MRARAKQRKYQPRGFGPPLGGVGPVTYGDEHGLAVVSPDVVDEVFNKKSESD